MPPGGEIMHKHLLVFLHIVNICKRNLIFNDVESFSFKKANAKKHGTLMVFKWKIVTLLLVKLEAYVI